MPRARGGPNGPDIVTRAEWGADESLKSTSGGCTRRFYRVQQLFVHHTAGTNNDADPAATMRAIYWYHTRSRGWCDIGYNFVVGPDGAIFEGRWARKYMPWESHSGEDAQGRAVAGAHVADYNSGSVGISMMGDFTRRATECGGARVPRRDAGVGGQPSRSEAEGLAPLQEPGLRADETAALHLRASRCRRHGLSRAGRLYAALPGIRQERRRPVAVGARRFEGHARRAERGSVTKRARCPLRHRSRTVTAASSRRSRWSCGPGSLGAGGAEPGRPTTGRGRDVPVATRAAIHDEVRGRVSRRRLVLGIAERRPDGARRVDGVPEAEGGLPDLFGVLPLPAGDHLDRFVRIGHAGTLRRTAHHPRASDRSRGQRDSGPQGESQARCIRATTPTRSCRPRRAPPIG